MPIETAEAIQFVLQIVKKERVRVNAKEFVKAGVAVGLSTIAGGLIFGPIGLAVGACISGIATAISSHDKFLDLPMVVVNMTAREREQLAAKVDRIARNLNVTDVAALRLLMAGDSKIHSQVVKEITYFITKEMKVPALN